MYSSLATLRIQALTGFSWTNRFSAACLTCLVVTLALAAEPEERLIEETWDAVYLDGVKAGFAHVTMHEFTRDGQKARRATTDLHLHVRRQKETIELRMETGTEETGTGDVHAVFMRQHMNKKPQLDLHGTVRGDELQLKVRGFTSIDRKIPWDKTALSLSRELRLFQDRKIKFKDRLSYTRFEPTVSSLVTVRVAVCQNEEVDVLGAKKTLLRVEAVPDKIQTMQLPSTIYWLDKDLRPVRWQTEMAGLGTAVFYRTSAEEARKPGADAPDVTQNQRILLNRRLDSPHESETITYRIKRKKNSAEDLAQLFAVDARQSYLRLRDDTFEVRVKNARMPPLTGKADKPGAEYLANCYFIDWKNARIHECSRAAVGEETDPWKKALLIEKWVFKNMRQASRSEPLTPASRAARLLEGNVNDCALLSAALARAEGIPSRTALGLIYDAAPGPPAMRYHLWTEVWIHNGWQPIDATLGKGGIGAAHLKIADESWKDVKSLTPLLPLLRVWRNVEIEVASVK